MNMYQSFKVSEEKKNVTNKKIHTKKIDEGYFFSYRFRGSFQ